MPLYNYHCQPCEKVFEEFASMAEWKDPQKCPSCEELCERTAEGQDIHAHGIGLKSRRSDSDKANVEHRWMQDEIENTKKAVATESGASPYTEYKINHEVAQEKGICTTISDKDKKSRDADRQKATSKLTEGMSENDIHYTKIGNANRGK